MVTLPELGAADEPVTAVAATGVVLAPLMLYTRIQAFLVSPVRVKTMLPVSAPDAVEYRQKPPLPPDVPDVSVVLPLYETAETEVWSGVTKASIKFPADTVGHVAVCIDPTALEE